MYCIIKKKPIVICDVSGVYITVSCGNTSGHLYLKKLDESKKTLGKCILAKGSWHSPPEFELLGGKKSRRWRQSISHQN